jgi:hypothetical protein
MSGQSLNIEDIKVRRVGDGGVGGNRLACELLAR